jgi:hypothetical protein
MLELPHGKTKLVIAAFSIEETAQEENAAAG